MPVIVTICKSKLVCMKYTGVIGVTGVTGVTGAQPRNKRVKRIKDSIEIYKQIFRSHPKASQWGGKRGSARRLIPGVRRS